MQADHTEQNSESPSQPLLYTNYVQQISKFLVISARLDCICLVAKVDRMEKSTVFESKSITLVLVPALALALAAAF